MGATKSKSNLPEDPDDASYLPAADGRLARKSGEWAKRKHYFLRNYCGITTMSMRKRFRLIYLDVMAGPGRCKIKETGEEFAGSPFVALDHDFAEYILIEDEPELAAALQKRVAAHPKARNVKVISENWVDVVTSGRLNFDASTLVVAFIDPTGISQTPMSAMRKLASNPRIDLLVTIQHRLGIVWNTPHPTTGERWFCPNGPRAGEFFDNWIAMPASCWLSGIKPRGP